MDNPGTTIEEYVQFETENALRNNQVYDWETAKNERHGWLRFDTQGYTKEEIQDYETRLGKIYYRKVHRVQVLDFARLDEIEDGDLDMTERLRMQHKGDDGEMETDGFGAYWEAGLIVIASKKELVDYWTRISSGDFLASTPSYTLIIEPLRRLRHRLIAFTISGRGQALEKVTTTNLFFLRSMDEGTVPAASMIEGFLSEQARYSSWMVDWMTELMEHRGMRYHRFDGRIIPDTHFKFKERRVRQRTDGASASAYQPQPQPQP
uniref:Uncharacterized protein n=1 Tax=Tanacetum cinerariifolium TaxID=118510 RepID=A0A699H0G4_TANCI|nr:hypothetical protein [Tanacetum cinerariifolium]